VAFQHIVATLCYACKLSVNTGHFAICLHHYAGRGSGSVSSPKWPIMCWVRR